MMRFLLFLMAAPVFAQLSQAGGPAEPVACKGSAFVSMTSSATAQVIAGQAGQAVYICGFLMNAGGNTTGQLVQGEGSNCASNQTQVTPAFKFTNGSTIAFGGSVGTIVKLAAGRSLCVVNSSGQDLHLMVSFATL
jgi:hypothetical protein